TDRCCDRGSRLIEASQKTSSHSISERSNFDESYCGNQGEKRSNTLSKRRYEINKVLHKSVNQNHLGHERLDSFEIHTLEPPGTDEQRQRQPREQHADTEQIRAVWHSD
ncbi:hypothetical protein SAMN05443661_1091, partial [Natronobacterium gregoryi]